MSAHDDDFDIEAVLSSIDPTLEIEDPNDRKYFDECLARPRHKITKANALWLKAVQDRGGISFRRWNKQRLEEQQKEKSP